MIVAVLGLVWIAWHLSRDADTLDGTHPRSGAEEGEIDDPPELIGVRRTSPVPKPDLSPVEHGGIGGLETVRVPFNGAVVDSAGSHVGAAEMVLSREEGSISFSTDDEGLFQVEVPAGRYDLSIHKAGVGGLHVQGETVDGGSGSDRTFQLEAPATFALRYHDGQNGLAGLRTTIRLRALGRPDALTFTGLTDGDGTVRLDDVIKGFYDVETHIRPGWIQRREAWNSKVGRTEGVSSPVPSGKGGVLSGVVRDLDTGAPVAGAKLTLLMFSIGSGSWLESAVTSSADGAYSFEPVIGQIRALYAEADGYARWPRDHFEGREVTAGRPVHQAEPPFGSFNLSEGLDMEYDVGLRRGRCIEGVVRDADGSPVGGMTLGFRPISGTGREPPDEHVALTDAHGRYRVECLREVQYGVHVIDADWFLPRFYGVQLGSRDLPAGVITLDVEVSRGRALRGTVLHADGKPAFGARVWIGGAGRVAAASRAQSQRMETYSAQDGSWVLESTPLGHELTLQAALGSDVSRPVATGEEAAQDMVLVLSPTGSVQGRVQCEDADPRWHALVHLDPVGEPTLRTRRHARVDGDGQFQFERVTPGRWSVLVLLGSRSSAHPVEIDVRANEAESIEVRLVNKLTLSGIVVDGAGTPVASVRVLLRGRYHSEKSDWKRVKRSAMTGDQGRYEFPDLPAGEYEVRLAGSRTATASRRQLVGHERDIRLIASGE